jgi:hypothetical protein|nr:hypothetical protein [Azonexus sp.]
MEAYPLVEKIVVDLNRPIKDILGDGRALKCFDAARHTDERFGLPTVQDIFRELTSAARDHGLNRVLWSRPITASAARKSAAMSSCNSLNRVRAVAGSKKLGGRRKSRLPVAKAMTSRLSCTSTAGAPRRCARALKRSIKAGVSRARDEI